MQQPLQGNAKQFCIAIITESENLPLLKKKKVEAFQLSATVWQNNP